MSKRALVVGGTGPTGPDVVNGLLERGFEVTIFHSGRHEVPFAGDVRHVHGDAHFADAIADALGPQSFDVVIAQYGRLRHLIEHFKGRAGHVVAIGGMNAPLAAAGDQRWGRMGKPAIVREDDRILLDAHDPDNPLGFKIVQASQSLLDAHHKGHFTATYIVYPVLYGPRQPGCPEWHIVRRLRDQRQKMIVPDGGLKLESRGFVHNVSQAPLLAVDQPAVSAGRSYVVADADIFTVRQRIEFIATYLDRQIELVDLPYELAAPAYPLYRHGPAHRACFATDIRRELGYVDRFDTAAGLQLTVDWLLENPQLHAELETQLGDPFDYQFEDRLINAWETALSSIPRPDSEYEYSHIYRHPKEEGENWSPRDVERP